MTSKFEQIKQHIFKQIESGQWPEHHRVPSENELAESFSVSRMTARRALQELSDEGVLNRTQGLGTFVASFKTQASVLHIRNIADEIHERGHAHHCTVHQLDTLSATSEVAIALGISVGSPVFISVKTHFENQKPIQVEQRFVNPTLVPEYNKQDFSTVTPHEYLSKMAPLTEATHIIEAVLPSQQTAKWLHLSTAEPCLQIQRRTWSKQGVVSFARLTYPGSRYRLGGHLTF